jgi:hypothetical protein
LKPWRRKGWFPPFPELFIWSIQNTKIIDSIAVRWYVQPEAVVDFYGIPLFVKCFSDFYISCWKKI